ncbi:MAG: hypothetical protein QN168_09645 [Armatimonadota bacterium]|nr:hypothetical protein [Armatimonadota bacterium]
MFLVGYDVAGVHRYVFEPVRPVDIFGGSALLERFAEEAAKVASEKGATAIYSAGGTGLFLAGTEGAAASLVGRLPEILDGLTAGGARCTVARVQFRGDFRADRRLLADRLRAERFRKALEDPPRVLLPMGTRPAQVCEACGREGRTVTRRVGNREEELGPRCQARYMASRGRAPTIAEVLGGDGDDVPRGAVLAAVYVDADGLGTQLAEVRSAEELGRFSKQLTHSVQRAVERAIQALAPLPVIQVAVGGDDALLFCDAARLPELASALWEVLGHASSELGVRFSTGVVLGEPFLPLRLYFAEAEEALREAKRHSHATGRACAGVRALMAGTRHGVRGDLLGGPLPQEAFTGEGGVWRLVELVRAVGPSQRAGLGDELALKSREEAALSVEYRASRDKAVGEAYLGARNLAELYGVEPLALLGGALALSAARERWEPAREGER